MTIDQLIKKTSISYRTNQANKAARTNAERLIKNTGARTLAEALGRK